MLKLLIILVLMVRQESNMYVPPASEYVSPKEELTQPIHVTWYINPKKAGTPKVTAGKKKATVKLTRVTGAKGYEIYMATSRNGKYKKIATKNASTIKVTKSKLSSGKKYYFKVRAYNKTASGSKVYEGYSSIKSVKVK